MKRFVTREIDLSGWEEGASYTLPADVAHHACTVMRMGPGDELELVDAAQNLITAKIQKSGDVLCTSHASCAITPKRFNITLGVALFKWPRFEWMLEKITELGVTRLIPLDCERSVIKVSDWDKKSDRLEKIIVEASRQSLNPCPPTLEKPQKLTDFLKLIPRQNLFFAHLGDYPTLAELGTKLEGDIAFVIGPEGGFSPNEVELLSQNASPISLGHTVLRAETAAIACACSLALL